MPDDAKTRTTNLVATLPQTGGATSASAEELLPLVYDELRRLARRYLANEGPGHTLQPTALVHEAYLRLVDGTQVDWQGRTHFFAIGARAMRRILIDHARARGAAKRGGERLRVTFVDDLPEGRDFDLDQLLSLDAAFQKLHQLDERQAQVVELRFFAGLTVEEIANLLEVSKRTVEGDWTHARAWLSRELAEAGQP